MMCAMWIRTFLSRSTGERDARIKLYKKWFPKTLIETKIESSLEEIRDWSNHAREIESKISSLIKKGKSTQIISLMLTGTYPYFRDQIQSLMWWFSDDSGLQKEIEKYKLKYNLSDPREKQKFNAAIQRKWFRYDAIKNALAEARTRE
jgi:SOS response regulatory protein OraA/RecX